MPKQVLIIDDDRAIADVTALWLRHAGYEVHCAHDGALGLDRARQWSPDVILLDIRMPGMDGYAVCRQLKSDAQLASIPVVFFTANVQDAARRKASASGGEAFIVKPYESNDVLDAVQHVLARTGPQPRENNHAAAHTSPDSCRR